MTLLESSVQPIASDIFLFPPHKTTDHRFKLKKRIKLGLEVDISLRALKYHIRFSTSSLSASPPSTVPLRVKWQQDIIWFKSPHSQLKQNRATLSNVQIKFCTKRQCLPLTDKIWLIQADFASRDCSPLFGFCETCDRWGTAARGEGPAFSVMTLYYLLKNTSANTPQDFRLAF